MMNRTWGRLAATVLALLLPAAASAQAYPAKPVRMVVPFAAGGTTDVIARQLAQKLGEAWGQTVIVENKAGAGGNIGAADVAKAAPDGYTILMTSGSIVTANQYIYPNMGFDPEKDLLAVTNVASGPQLYVVNPSLPVKDLKEFLEYAKKNNVTFGSAGVGTQTHLAGENLAYQAKVNMTHVPYKGEAAALTDLIGGQIHMVPANFPAAVVQIKGGRVKALAVSTKERSPQLPDVPAVAEFVPGFVNDGWWGLMVPAGTPKAIVDKIQADSAKILTSPEFKAKLAEQGVAPVANKPAEFEAAIREERKTWQKVVKERGLVPK